MEDLRIPEEYRSGLDTSQRLDENREREFAALAQKWRKETLGLSRVDKKVTHPAYQQIIGMGPQVTPLILRELRDRPSYWFAALRSITREDPAQSAASFDEARDAWLAWGRDHNYMR